MVLLWKEKVVKVGSINQHATGIDGVALPTD